MHEENIICERSHDCRSISPYFFSFANFTLAEKNSFIECVSYLLCESFSSDAIILIRNVH